MKASDSPRFRMPFNFLTGSPLLIDFAGYKIPWSKSFSELLSGAKQVYTVSS